MKHQNISLKTEIKMEMQLSSCGSAIIKVTETLHWWSKTPTSNINNNNSGKRQNICAWNTHLDG